MNIVHKYKYSLYKSSTDYINLYTDNINLYTGCGIRSKQVNNEL